MKRIALGLLVAAISGPAWGQTCASLPYPLTNGTVANADQVMANLNCLALKGNGIFTGKVGIGTSTPSTNLQIVGTSGATQAQLGTASNGLSLNVYDGATTYLVGTSAGSQNLGFGTQNAGTLVFMTSNLGRVNITPDGNVGIGTGSPSKLLYVNGSAGGTQSWNQASDGRLKTNIVPIIDALKLIEQLNPVRYDWRKPSDRAVGKELNLPVNERQIGFIAQEVEKVVPEAVTTPAKGSVETYGLKQDSLIPVLVAAIKEQQAQIKALQDQVSALKTQH